MTSQKQNSSRNEWFYFFNHELNNIHVNSYDYLIYNFRSLAPICMLMNSLSSTFTFPFLHLFHSKLMIWDPSQTLYYTKNTQKQEHHNTFRSSNENIYIQEMEIPITWLRYCVILNHIYVPNFNFIMLPLNVLGGSAYGVQVFLIASAHHKHKDQNTLSLQSIRSSYKR